MPFSDPMESCIRLPTTSGSGNFGIPCLRMQAENATSASRLERPDTAAPVVVGVEPICGAPLPDEPPPHAAASSSRPTATISASAKRAYALGANAISSPSSQLTDSLSLSPLYEMGGYSTVTSTTSAPVLEDPRLDDVRHQRGPWRARECETRVAGGGTR